MKVQQIIKDCYAFFLLCHFCDTFVTPICHCGFNSVDVTPVIWSRMTFNVLDCLKNESLTDKSQKAPSLRWIWLEMERPKYNIFDRKFYKKTWSEKIKVSHSISYQTLETIFAHSDDWNNRKFRPFYYLEEIFKLMLALDGALSLSSEAFRQSIG